MVKTLKFVHVMIFFLSLILVAHNCFLVAQNFDGKVKTLVTLQDFFFFFRFGSCGGVKGSCFSCVFVLFVLLLRVIVFSCMLS